MKKTLLFKLLLLAIPVVGMVLLNSFSGGVGDFGRTGSPGDPGADCSACHTGDNNLNNVPSISTTIPPEGYTSGQTYQVTVSATSTGASYGFQITAEEDVTDTKVGTWASTDGSTQLVLGGTHITHTSSNPTGSWTFDWTAPNTDEGAITFYAVVNAVNGNGNTLGDQVVTTSLSVTSNVLNAEDVIFADLKLYPNPTVEHLSLDLPSTIATAVVTAYDHLGQEMFTTTVAKENNILDVSHFQDGVYLLSIQADGKRTTKSFIKR